ncbi:MAG: glycerol-3-phosphate acyltransferase [Firmicutes bacterium]|nr:glycerol-3-phosphate acyltransferase [Bacillota bacterium]
MNIQEVIILIALLVGSYLIGNINFAVLISKLKKSDVRNKGSGNPGTMNMIREYGKFIGAITLIADVAKGAIPALIGWYVVGGIGFGQRSLTAGIFMDAPPRLGLYVAGVGVMLGHVFPVFFKFKGGKGIATALGVGLIAQPLIAPFAFGFGALFIHLTKLGALGSFSIISMPLAVEAFMLSSGMYEGQALWGIRLASIIIIFTMFSFTLFTHRKNIINLFSGTEHRTLIWGKEAKAIKEAKRQKALEEQSNA